MQLSEEKIHKWTVLGGVILLLLLPVGMLSGVNSTLFTSLFLIHLVLLTSALVLALKTLGQVCEQNNFQAVVIFGLIFLIAIQSLLPVTARDALTHHLAVPKWWLAEGRIYATAWHEWSFYPMLLQLGFTGLMRFGLDRLCSLYHLCYLILTAAIIANFLFSRRNNLMDGFWGALITLSLPTFIKNGSAPLVDLGLLYFCTSALILIVYWAENVEKWKLLPLAGAALGLALSTKYNGLVAAATFFPLMIILGKQKQLDTGKILKAAFLIGCTTALVYAPWLVKNEIFTGNPFFPLFKSYFGPFNQVSAPFRGLNPLELRLRLYNESWFDLLLLPLRMLFLGADDNPKFFDGVLSPIFLLSLLTVFKKRGDAWVIFLTLFTTVYFLLAVTMAGARIRYLFPILGVIIILASLGIGLLLEIVSKKREKLALALIISIQILVTGPYVYALYRDSGTLPYWSGMESKESYLQKRLPEYGLIKYVNENLPFDSKLYLLYTSNKFYYFEREVYSGGHFSALELLRWLKSCEDVDSLLLQFSNRKINYLFVNTNKLKESFTELLAPEDIPIWNDFLSKHLELLVIYGDYSLWKIK